jgi:deoxyribonuclease-4
MSKAPQKPRIGAHTPTSGGMAKRSIAYAELTGAEAIRVLTSNPRGWAMPETNHEADALFREKAESLDIETYVHAPFINSGSPTEETYKNSLASTAFSLNADKRLALWELLCIQAQL